jgi:hypothetical protein
MYEVYRQTPALPWRRIALFENKLDTIDFLKGVCGEFSETDGVLLANYYIGTEDTPACFGGGDLIEYKAVRQQP